MSRILQDNTPFKIYGCIPLIRFFLHCSQAASFRIAHTLFPLWHAHAITPTSCCFITPATAFGHSLQSPIPGPFQNNTISFHLPALNQQTLDDAIDEIELLGFPLCNVFELVDEDRNKHLPGDKLEKYLGKEVNVLGYLITTKPLRTIKNDTMYLHTFIDSKGHWLDAVCFPQTAIR